MRSVAAASTLTKAGQEAVASSGLTPVMNIDVASSLSKFLPPDVKPFTTVELAMSRGFRRARRHADPAASAELAVPSGGLGLTHASP